MSATQNICQVAFSTLDAKALQGWYQQVFGLVHAGSSVFSGPTGSRVMGLPDAWGRRRWLVDGQHHFQLEFCQFWKPVSKPRPTDWAVTDIGYNMLGIVVHDFDGVFELLQRLACKPVTAPIGAQGNRRLCVKDPEGNLVEIYERDPLPEAVAYTDRPEMAAVVRCITVSVPDLQRARYTWVDTLGLQPLEDTVLHTDADSLLWGGSGAKAQRLLVSSGNFLVELVQYERPDEGVWPVTYRVCDQGFMNIGIGLPNTEAFDSRVACALQHGMAVNGRPLDIGISKAVSVADADGFSMRLLTVRPGFWFLSGFEPGIPYVESEIWIDANAETVWETITDHAAMGDWCLFSTRLLQPGEAEPNGKGAVRELRGLGLKLSEEILGWQPPNQYSYRLTAGAAIKNHMGHVLLTPKNDGTKVRWTIQFTSGIPGAGRPLALLLQLIFGSALQRLKQQIEASAN